MDNPEHVEEREDDPIISVIQNIKDGAINPKTLSHDKRLRCVDFLVKREGYTEEQAAQILGRCERTIRRDLREIEKNNALTADIDLAKRIAGDVVQGAMTHHRYLMRLARSLEASPGEKAQAEFMAWRVLKEMTEKLQTLGYLPTTPQAVVSDIYHHQEGGDRKTYDELKQDLKEIERVASETGTLDPKTEEGIKLLQQRIEKAEIVEQVSDLSKDKDGQHKNTEVTNEQ